MTGKNFDEDTPDMSDEKQPDPSPPPPGITEETPSGNDPQEKEIDLKCVVGQ